jgi:HEAT repeat protein
LVTTSPVALYALGALANRGSSHAAQLLAAHLNDPSPSTRRRALAVLGQLRPQVALPVLEAAEPSLQYPDMKAMVERVVERVKKRAGG